MRLCEAPAGDACDAGFIDELRGATNGGWALGDPRFKREIANALGRRGRASAQRTAVQAEDAGSPAKSTLIPL